MESCLARAADRVACSARLARVLVCFACPIQKKKRNADFGQLVRLPRSRHCESLLVQLAVLKTPCTSAIPSKTQTNRNHPQPAAFHCCACGPTASSTESQRRCTRRCSFQGTHDTRQLITEGVCTCAERHTTGGMWVHQLPKHRHHLGCLLYTSPSPRDRTRSRMPSSA